MVAQEAEAPENKKTSEASLKEGASCPTTIEAISSQARRRFLVYCLRFGIFVVTIHPLLQILILKNRLALSDITFNIVVSSVCVTLLILLRYLTSVTTFFTLLLVFFGTFNLAFSSPTAPSAQSLLFLTLAPSITFFIYGKKIGTVLAIAFTIAAITYNNLFAHFYPAPAIFQLVFTLATLTLLLYFYEDIKEKTQNLLQRRDEEIQKTNDLLKEEIETRKAAQEQLALNLKKITMQKEELERFNRLVVGRELKMAEMKKEIEELKKKVRPQLKRR